MVSLIITETPTDYKIRFDFEPRMTNQLRRIGLYLPGEPNWDRWEKVWIVRKRIAMEPYGHSSWFVNAFADWAYKKGLCLKPEFKKEIPEWEQDNLPPLKPIEGKHHMLISPFPFQLEGVDYALSHKRCIFGDQPGLGKTLQAICSVVKAHKESDKYGESFPVLVICPASLKINWKREFEKFAGVKAVILDDKNKNSWHNYIDLRNANGDPISSVFITNYESLGKFFVKERKPHKRMTLKSIVFDERIKLFRSVIIDESHKCKSSKTQQSKYVEGICQGKEFIFALTGTPVVNKNTDLIQQLKILNRLDDFGGYYRFQQEYCSGANESSSLKKLNHYLRKHCFFRREKKDVLKQLPDKTRQYVVCDITNREEYHAAEKDIITYMRQYKNADDEKIARTLRGEVMVRMSQLKAISARGKIKAVSEFIHDIVDSGEKLIIFAYLKEVVDALKAEFPDAVTVTGSDNTNQKQSAVDRFQTDPACKLIILNYKSGGTGLTLTAASRVGFIEFPWTYSDCEQAEDRAHRNGQKNAVNCYYFLGEKTIDYYMYRVVQNKKQIASEVTGTTTHVEEDVVSIAMDLFKERL